MTVGAIQISSVNVYEVWRRRHLTYFNVMRGMQCEAMQWVARAKRPWLNDQLIDTLVDIIRNAIVLNVRFPSRKSVVCPYSCATPRVRFWRHPRIRDNIKFRASCFVRSRIGLSPGIPRKETRCDDWNSSNCEETSSENYIEYPWQVNFMSFMVGKN